MRVTAVKQSMPAEKPRERSLVPLFLGALVLVLVAALFFPGAALVVAALAIFTPLRRNKRLLVWLVAVAVALTLASIIVFAVDARLPMLLTFNS